ncbi:hypothetical protein J7T55_008972 [Diaporthe amygdali]|uniref:uncharacterized protein n=1 Tax=Phomopsis amygdali TaxID=1214568 RepID=UPI0022FECBCE|nr:uncharacterized protein J7T55_008972 [Diaporthe amygdali]KAJ0118189.1 hypothetical protein J7T55_008972 [Diaporthe amygdali]
MMNICRPIFDPTAFPHSDAAHEWHAFSVRLIFTDWPREVGNDHPGLETKLIWIVFGGLTSSRRRRDR